MRLLDPFDNLPDDAKYRTSVKTSHDTAGMLLRVHGRDGTIKNTVNFLLHRLQQILEQNGITAYEPDIYESTVLSVAFTVPGGAVGGPTPTVQSSSGHDGRRSGAVARRPAGAPPVASNVDRPLEGDSTKKRKTAKRGKV